MPSNPSKTGHAGGVQGTMRWLTLAVLILGLERPAVAAGGLDFSAGFERMGEVGLPDLNGAKWVRLEKKPGNPLEEALWGTARPLLTEDGEADEEEDEEADGGKTAPSKPEKRRMGRAWLLPSSGGQPGLVIVDQWKPAKALAGPEAEKVQARLTALTEKYGGMQDSGSLMALSVQLDTALNGWTAAGWQPADLRGDVAAVEERILSLRRIGDTETNADPARPGAAKPAPKPLAKLGADDIADSGLPTYFLFACNIWRSGEKDLANRLATAIFDAVDNPQALLDSTMTQLGEAQLETIGRTFDADHDWSAYAAALETLKGRFTRGWPKAVGLEPLIAGAKRRSAGERPKLALEGISFSAEDHNLATQLLNSTGGAGIVWTLPPAAEAAEAASGKGAETEAAAKEDAADEEGSDDADDADGDSGQSKLWTLTPPPAEPGGMNAIAAKGMGGIPILTALLKCDLLASATGGTSERRFVSFGDDGQPSPLEAFNALDRPRTLAELAESALRDVVPIPAARRMSSSDDDDDVKSLATAAMAFFRQHGKSTAGELRRHYLKNGTPAQQTTAVREILAQPQPETDLIEEHFLTAPGLDRSDAVTAYVRARGPAAAGFFKKYAEALKASVSPNDAFPGSVDRLIAQLDPIVNKKSLIERLRDFETASDRSKAWPALRSALSTEPAGEVIGALLAHAVETNSPSMTMTSLLLMLQARKAKVGPAIFTEPPHREKWERLLADERPLPHPLRPRYGWSIGSGTAMIVEWLAQKGQPDSDLTLATRCRTTDPTRDALTLRARARVAGQPVPAWPFNPPLPADQRQAIAATAKTKSAEAIGPWLESLSMAEWLAVAMAPERPFPKAWLEATRLVGAVEVPEGPWKDAYAWEGLSGRKLDAAGVQAVVAALLQRPLPAGGVYIHTNPRISALTVCVEPIDPYVRQNRKDDQGFLVVNVQQMNGAERRSPHRLPLPHQPARAPSDTESPAPASPEDLASQLAFLDRIPEKELPGSFSLSIEIFPVEADPDADPQPAPATPK